MIQLPQWYQRLLQEMVRKVKASLQKDTKYRAETAEAELEAFLTLDPPLLK